MDLTVDITLPRRSFDLRVELNFGPETIALVGPSGSGKTSLLRAIAGLEPLTQGLIAFGSEPWLDSPRDVHLRPERRRVGYLPQDYGLFPHLTVAANVRFAARRDRRDLLERLHVTHLADARPGQLSGGERQRVALARALAREPHVLLLDEPFAALDTTTRQHVRDELADILMDLRLPTLLVTHAFEDANVLGSRVGVLDHGRMVQVGPASELERNPASVMVAALTGANILHGVATRTQSGSRVLLDGGGELLTDTPATGVVALAVQPWALTLSDRNASPLTDRVLDVREDRGTIVIRLTRLTVHIPASAGGAPSVTKNALVGLRAAPHRVRVLPPDSGRPSR
jgi:molybdate transport system ATP-binding protein